MCAPCTVRGEGRNVDRVNARPMSGHFIPGSALFCQSRGAILLQCESETHTSLPGQHFSMLVLEMCLVHFLPDTNHSTHLNICRRLVIGSILADVVKWSKVIICIAN